MCQIRAGQGIVIACESTNPVSKGTPKLQTLKKKYWLPLVFMTATLYALTEPSRSLMSPSTAELTYVLRELPAKPGIMMTIGASSANHGAEAKSSASVPPSSAVMKYLSERMCYSVQDLTALVRRISVHTYHRSEERTPLQNCWRPSVHHPWKFVRVILSQGIRRRLTERKPMMA